jgi:hypothetical protein
MKHFHGWVARGATQQFAARHRIRPHVERFPVTRVNEALDLTHPGLSLDTEQR